MEKLVRINTQILTIAIAQFLFTSVHIVKHTYTRNIIIIFKIMSILAGGW